LYDEKNGKAHCDTHRQTRDINEREDLVSPQIPECCFKIILEHVFFFINDQ